MVTVYDIKHDVLIKKASEELMKLEVIRKPQWANYVKTSAARERMPIEQNWWYIRAASILRKMYILNVPTGTNKLKNLYGGRKNRGHKPEKFYKGSGKIIRTILQQLEKAGYVKAIVKGVHKGRIITTTGKNLLDRLAKNV